MGVVVGGDCSADRTSQSSANYRTIPAADFIADRRTRRAADTAADRRIQGGIIRERLNGCQRKRQHQIFRFHSHRECPEKLDVQLIIDTAQSK